LSWQKRRFRTEQYRTVQYRTEQNRTEQNRTEQNRTEQNRTEHILLHVNYTVSCDIIYLFKSNKKFIVNSDEGFGCFT